MLYVSEEYMMKSSNISRGQKQPEKRDARSQSPPPTHNPRRCHLNHELVPAEENLNRIDSFLMIPSSLLSEEPYRELPGESKLLYGHLLGLLRLSAQESQRQALCEPLAGQCGAIAALPAGESRRLVCLSGTLRFAGTGAGTVKRKGAAVLPQPAPAQGTQRAVTTRREIRPDLSEKRTGS